MRSYEEFFAGYDQDPRDMLQRTFEEVEGYDEVVVKTKNRYYDMRSVLAQLQFNVVKHESSGGDIGESKVYLSKMLPAELARGHRSVRTVVYSE